MPTIKTNNKNREKHIEIAKLLENIYNIYDNNNNLFSISDQIIYVPYIFGNKSWTKTKATIRNIKLVNGEPVFVLICESRLTGDEFFVDADLEQIFHRYDTKGAKDYQNYKQEELINYIEENLLESESDRIEFITSMEPVKGFEIYQKYRKEIVVNYLKKLEEEELEDLDVLEIEELKIEE